MSATLDSSDLVPNSQALPRSKFLRFPWSWLALAVILLVYAIYISSNFAPAITEPDDNGYFAQGTRWAETGQTWFTPESDAQYIGMHWLVTPSGQYISRYPPGLAVMIGVLYKIGGYTLAAWINPIFSILALLGIFLATRRIATAPWALAAVVILAANPTFVRHTLAGDSHMGVACAIAWGLYFLLKWAESPKKLFQKSRPHCR